jgi:hypothetical protein
MQPLEPDDPRVVGEYAIVGKLGEGGMGRVYQGRTPGGRWVAVKIARSELAVDPTFRSRFRTEVAAARKVGGFHTAQVIDADPDATPPWMVTAFVPGLSLAGTLAANGPLTEGGIRALGAGLAEALRAIHACGLVHRDLKPSNIIMADDGPRVLDFGIARAVMETRLTRSHMRVGTPGFLAPEQIRDQAVGPAADVFALGAVLVHSAGGKPFGDGDAVALLYRAVHDEPDLSAVPVRLRPLVAACLDKEPDRRPTPGQLLAELAPATVPTEVLADLPAGRPGQGSANEVSTIPAGHAKPVQLPRTRVESVAQPGATGQPASTGADAAPLILLARLAERVSRGILRLFLAAVSTVLFLWGTQQDDTSALPWLGLVMLGVGLWALLSSFEAFFSRHRVILGPTGVAVHHEWPVHERHEFFVPWTSIASVRRRGSGAGDLVLGFRLRSGVPLPPKVKGMTVVAPDEFAVKVPWPPAALTTTIDQRPNGASVPPTTGQQCIGEAIRRYAPHVGVDQLWSFPRQPEP